MNFVVQIDVEAADRELVATAEASRRLLTRFKGSIEDAVEFFRSHGKEKWARMMLEIGFAQQHGIAFENLYVEEDRMFEIVKREPGRVTLAPIGKWDGQRWVKSTHD